jgi:alpha-galactosidase
MNTSFAGHSATATFAGMSLVLTALSYGQGVADKPPMGWSSFDCYGYAVIEEQVKANADFMAKNLKQFGWEYVVVDYVWAHPLLGPGPARNQDAQLRPRLNMDAFGRLIPDTTRFPSSSKGRGFKALGDYVHALGLKFGIHVMRGIPRQAVAENSPILNSPVRGGDIADRADTCLWLNHMYGVDLNKPGGQEYLNSLADLYASWGVDFLKVDDLSEPYHQAEVEGYQAAIARCGRPIVFSTSPGPTPIENALHIQKNANMWRLLADLWDTWPDVSFAFDQQYRWYSYAGPGHWPDLDKLPLGKLAKYGPVGEERFTRLTRDEQVSLITLWCITRAPLMFGGNLPENDEFTESLLTNEEVLAVNQESADNAIVYHGLQPIWVASVPGTRDKYLALFNRAERGPRQVQLTLSDIGVAKCAVRDLWQRKEMGEMTGHFSLSLPAHGAGLFRLTAIEPTAVTPHPIAQPPPRVEGKSYEAESPENLLAGSAVVVTDLPEAYTSGGQYVKGIGRRSASFIRFRKVVVQQAGLYSLWLYYMTAEERKAYVSANGGQKFYYTFPSTGGRDGFYLGVKEVKVTLRQGENSMEIGNETAWAPDVDRIVLVGEK